MNLYKRMFVRTVLALIILIFGLVSAGSAEDEYRIGPDDILEVKFWQDPALNSIVRVMLDGKISLDIIGQIEASGKTIEELQFDIVHQISRLNKRISQVVVRVMEYNYQHVFITGEILVKGKMTFEKIPNLWTIIKEAGGATEVGDLSRVTIIRGEKDAGKVEIVNVAEAITLERIENLPQVYRSDVIDIPRNPIGLPSDEFTGQEKKKKNLIYITGAVMSPGPVKFEDNMDILEALALAGGPGANAKIEDVQVITKDGNYGQTLHFNLNKYMEKGTIARYVLRKEDALYVPSKGDSRGFLGVGLGTAAAVLGVVSTTLLIWDRLDNNNNSSSSR